MEKLVITLWITFGIYMMLLLAILADLWSGIRKARKNGIARSSYGLKRTVDKMARYYNLLLALSVIDAMQMVSLWYLESFYGYKIPIFPFITLIGAIGLSFIEIISIFEKAEDKVRMENVGVLAGKIIANKDDISEIVKSVIQFMKENKTEDEQS